MELSRYDSRSALSDCSYSSGFQSMLGSPTGEHDFWANLQELENRVKTLEKGPTHPHSHTTVYDRSRHDSVSSSSSTVIDSHHTTQSTADLDAQGKLFMKNAITLTQTTLADMRKYKNVEVKIAIVGTELRGPEECTCTHECSEKCQANQTQEIEELKRQLERLAEENMILKHRLHYKDKYSDEETPSDVTQDLQEEEEGEENETTDVVEYSEETSKAHIEELKTLKRDRIQKFSIKSVVDPQSKKVISLDDAIAAKIVQLEKGIYFDNTTGEETPIPMAMRQQLIAVERQRSYWENIRESSVGIMTISRNVNPRGTLLVKEFKDTQTGEMVRKDVAIRRGITDITLGKFRDLQTGQTIGILQAIDQGFVTVEGNPSQPEVTRCIYKVSGVLDKRTNEVISYKDAIIRGILLQQDSLCKDTSSGKYIYLGFALLSGLMQVDPLENASDLEALQY